MMKIKDAIKGIFLAILAAFIFALILFGPSSGQDSDGTLILIVSGWALLNTSWFVIPAGAILGVLIPGFVAGKSARRAAVCGLLFGAMLGAVGSLLINTYFDVLPLLRGAKITNQSLWWASFFKRTASQALIMMIYCALWTTSYAYYRAKRSTELV